MQFIPKTKATYSSILSSQSYCGSLSASLWGTAANAKATRPTAAHSAVQYGCRLASASCRSISGLDQEQDLTKWIMVAHVITFPTHPKPPSQACPLWHFISMPAKEWGRSEEFHKVLVSSPGNKKSFLYLPLLAGQVPCWCTGYSSRCTGGPASSTLMWDMIGPLQCYAVLSTQKCSTDFSRTYSHTYT